VAWAILGDTVKRADLYEGLFGFIRPIADSLAGQRYIPSALADAVRARYGLNIPVLVVESLTSRFVSAGLLTVVTQTKDSSVYQFVGSEAGSANFVTERSIALMLERFRAFIRESAAEFAEHSTAKLDDAFFERLMHIDSLALLSRRDSPEALMRTRSTLSLAKPPEDPESRAEPTRQAEHLDYLFARFLLQMSDGLPDEFELLCEIAGANLVAETLLTYRDPPRKGDALQGLAVYLDAPLCMDILGVNIGRESYGQELARTLQASGVDICIFLHSISEIERVLEARRLSYLQAHPSGPGVHTVEPPAIRDRVRLIVGHVESPLTSEIGCRIVDAATSVPPAIRARVGAGEERAIRDALRGWSSDEGREVDVATVCDLIRLRSSSLPATRLPEAGPTLVTRNSLVKRTANEAWHQWLTQTNRATPARIKGVAPLAVTERHLAGLIWITQGGSIGDVSRELLVANCAAATAARRDVVVRVHNMLLNTSDQDAKLFEAIIMDQRAERALMDATFGDPQVITDDNVLDLLATARRATAEEITYEKNTEIALIAAERDAATTALRAQAAELDNIRRGIELSTQLADDERRKSIRADQAVAEKSFARACAVYKWAGVAVGVMLTAIALVAQVMLPDLLKDPTPDSLTARFAKAWWVPVALFAIPTLASIYEMPDMLFGGLRKNMADLAFRWLVRREGSERVLATSLRDYKTKVLRFTREDVDGEQPLADSKAVQPGSN